MIRISTRSSPLALWQAEYVAKQLQKYCHQETQIIPCITEGDRRLETSLAWKGGKGLFLKELQAALLENEADIAVHSMKDVPVDGDEAFFIASILRRDDPFDVFISEKFESLESLPQGAILGTSSLRRGGQISHLYPHLSIKLLRGNINTRINKCLQGEYDAIILAKAGIDRMQMQQYIKQVLPENICLPAIAQGAMGIECLSKNKELIKLLSQLDHQPTRLCVEAERQFNRRLEGNCHSPIACFAVLKEGEIIIKAVVTSPDGKIKLTHQVKGASSQSIDLADKLAQKMIDQGALSII
jgi:hydroxymethylbilane synthase